MKRFILTSVFLIAICPLFGQTVQNDLWTDLRALSGAYKMTLEIDYSDADVLGQEFGDFVAGEADWEKNAPEIRAKFIKAFNAEANDGPYPHRLGDYKDVEYKMVLMVTRVAERGTDVNANMFIYNAQDKVVFSHRVNGEGGQVGSVSNLMGDALADMGESVGKKFYWFARDVRNYLGW